MLLEMIAARMGGNDLLALLVSELRKAEAENVHLDTGGHQRDFGLFVLGYARRGVKRDRIPDHVNRLARDLVLEQELSRRVGAVDLEPFGSAAVSARQANVMKHCPDIE